MSIKWMTRAWDSEYEKAQLLLLLAIADFANDEGQCWPSIPTLARKARCSEAWVYESLNKFETDGWVKRIGKHGPSNLYQLYAPLQSVEGSSGLEVDPQVHLTQTIKESSTTSVVGEVTQVADARPWASAPGHDLPRSWTPSEEFLRRGWAYLKIWGLWEYVDHYLLRLKAISNNGKIKPNDEQFLAWLIKDERNAQAEDRRASSNGRDEYFDDGTPTSWST